MQADDCPAGRLPVLSLTAERRAWPDTHKDEGNGSVHLKIFSTLYPLERTRKGRSRRETTSRARGAKVQLGGSITHP